MSLLNKITGQIVELAVGAEDEFLALVADAVDWVGLTPAPADTGILVAEDLNDAELEPTPVEPTPVEPTPVEPTPVEPTPVEPTPIPPTEAEHG